LNIAEERLKEKGDWDWSSWESKAWKSNIICSWATVFCYSRCY